ncbi:hypothetical protein MKX01_023923 [Papaver californicum]|nr:hypothetical protein MKX01_023923 [Papaver californicum]
MGQKASLGPNMGLSPRWHLCFALVIFVIYLSRTMSPHQQSLGRAASAYITVASFFLGALCYGMAWYVGMWVSVRANVRNKECLWDFIVSHSHQHGCYYRTC